MSGICGLWDERSAQPEADLNALVQAAPYRAAGGVDTWRDKAVALAHASRKHAALAKETAVRGGCVLTASARLDNRDALGSALGLGNLETCSDASLILAAYRRWGFECPAKLLGDFAFCLWDGAEGLMFAARDPMGLRPFYYLETPGRFAFASEVQQLLNLDVPTELCGAAVGAHLVGQFGALEQTFYKSVRALKPGGALRYGGKSVRTWSYWTLDPEPVRYKRSEDYSEHFRTLFADAVSARLRGQERVGVLLSGGMDSGSVASAAGQFSANSAVDLHSYSFAFHDFPECDERDVSRHIVEAYGLKASDINADTHYPLAHYPDHGPHRDDPFLGAFQPLLEQGYARAQADGVDLLMSGDRGDLLVGDALYDPLGMAKAGRWHTLGQELTAYKAHYRELSWPRVLRRTLLKPLVLGALPQLRGRWDTDSAYPIWLRADFARRTGLSAVLEPPVPAGDVIFDTYIAKRRFELLFAPMHMRGVVWSERSQARFGLAFADPWSDLRLARFILGIEQWRVHRLSDPKRLAREAMRGVIPEAVRGRVGKVSPEPYYNDALLNKSAPVVFSLLENSRAAQAGFVDEQKLRSHYESARSGGALAAEFWWALTLEMWLRAYW